MEHWAKTSWTNISENPANNQLFSSGKNSGFTTQPTLISWKLTVKTEQCMESLQN